MRHLKPREGGRRRPPPDQRTPRPLPTQFTPREFRPPKGQRVVVGLHSVLEVFKVRPGKIANMWLKSGWESSREHRELNDLALRHRIAVQNKSPGQLDEVASSHQGVAVFVTETPELEWSTLEAPGPQVVMVLDQITDPHNLGAVLRTAWLSGVKAVFVPEDRAAHLGPAAAKVASGAAEHVPVVTEASLPSLLTNLKDKGFWIYGLSSKAAANLYGLKLNDKVVWVVGSEEKGIRSSVLGACDERVLIPQTTPHASYNASVAAAIALSETFRQFNS